MKITQKISTIRHISTPYFKEYIGTLLVVAFMCTVINVVPGNIINVFWPTNEMAQTISQVYLILLSGPLQAAEAILFLSAFRNKCAGMNSIILGFNNSAKKIQLAISIYFRTLIGFILFVVPGFYIALKYTMAFYVLADHPEYSVRQCLSESARLMYGNKWKYIKLLISYVPLMVVCSLPRCVVAYFTMKTPLVYDEKALALAYTDAFTSPLCVLCGIVVLYASCSVSVSEACFYDIAAAKLVFSSEAQSNNTTNNKSIDEYIELLEKEDVLSDASSVSCKDYPVENLCFDSREVTKNTLFVCKGSGFKEEYINSAKEKGAIWFVSEIEYDIDNLILVKDIRRAMALLSGMFFDAPWKEFKLVGLTGTKGKSTTLSYIINIMECAKVCGKDRFGYISTIDTYTGKQKFESHLTTPEAIELGKDLREIADSNLYAAGMEVSSQALKYDRTYGLEFDIGCFTNFAKDHIGDTEHPDMEDYLNSKLKFLDQCKTIIVNLDTDRIDEILPRAKNGKLAKRLVTYSAKDNSADYFIENVRKEDGLIKFSMTEIGEISLTMPGLFNAENAALAAIVSKLLGATNDEIREGLLNAKAAGRMEVFENKDRDLVVISDYAHNALSFERLFTSVKAEYPGYRIEALFGCPGGKGFSRREDLPKVAAKYVDFVWITEEDPANEDPSEICKVVFDNLVRNGGTGKIVVDREEAITNAIKNAPPKTVVLLIAKGREEYMHRGYEYVPIKSDSCLAEELINQ